MFYEEEIIYSKCIQNPTKGFLLQIFEFLDQGHPMISRTLFIVLQRTNAIEQTNNNIDGAVRFYYNSMEQRPF
jgi:hypothetical protein